MIFIQPFILASEFIEHTIAIVLTGFMVVEFVQCRRYFHIRPAKKCEKKMHHAGILLSAVLLIAIWLIVEFFIDVNNHWYHIAFHWPIVTISLLLVWCVIRHSHSLVRYLFIVLTVFALAHFVLDIVSMIFMPGWSEIMRSLFKLIEAFLSYFLILQFLIRHDHETL